MSLSDELGTRQTYLLTVWQEAGGLTWRAALRSGTDGARLGFADLEQLAAFLLRLPEQSTAPATPAPPGSGAVNGVVRHLIDGGGKERE